MDFTGTWTALITPMTADGAVDWEGLEKNIAFQIQQGITGLLPTGTTGESPTLDWEEHNGVIETALKQASGKCGVIAGTGSNSTHEAIESTHHAVENGAKAVLLMDCYYNGPSSLELRKEYYGAIARRFPDTQLVPYVIPGRTGTVLAAEDLAILASEYGNVNSVKEATGDLTRMAYTRKLVGSGFYIMSGDDDLTYEMMTRDDIRANGVISVITNVVPAAVTEMSESILSGDMKKAEALKDALAPLFGIVTVKAESKRIMPDGSTITIQDRFRNPLAVKTLMQALGMPSGPGRQPLGKMTAEGAEVVRAAMRKVWNESPEILKPISDFYGVDIESRIEDNEIWNKLSY